jgi:hypothetical protein
MNIAKYKFEVRNQNARLLTGKGEHDISQPHSFSFKNLRIECSDLVVAIFDGNSYFDTRKLEELAKNFVHFEEGFSDFLNNIIGDFSLLVYLKRIKKVFLARDAMGHKLCYYHVSTNFASFSNESMILLDAIPHPKVNPLYVYEYLSHLSPGYTECDFTPFDSIERVPYGSYVSYDFQSERTKKNRYFSPSSIEFRSSITEREAVHLLDVTIKQSVQDALDSAMNAKIGLTVSGGLDSSLLCHYFKNSGYDISYYNFLPTNLDSGFSEASYLKSIEGHFGFSVKTIGVGNYPPTLFESIIGGNPVDSFEPGSLYSRIINQTIISYLQQDSCDTLAFGHNETMFAALCEQMVIDKEFQEQPIYKKILYPVHCIGRSLNSGLVNDNYLMGWNNFMGIYERKYDESLVFSRLLHQKYLSNYENTFWSTVPQLTSQELKYHSVLRPGGELLINEMFGRYGITCCSPMHDKNMLKYILSIPTYLSWCQKKYLLKKLHKVPKDIARRPKISSSSTPYIKSAMKAAAVLLSQDLCMAPLINEDLFRKICRNMIDGIVPNVLFTRKFNTLVGLENFLRVYKLDVEV